MKKLRIKQTLLLAAISCFVGLGFSSCNNYLNIDSYLYDMTSLDSIFSRKQTVEQYVFGAAALLPDESHLWTTSFAPYQVASDENIISWNDDRHAGMKLLRNEITAYSGYFDNWENYYRGIRKANIVMGRINECKDASEMDKRLLVGKVLFLRGYFYYLLLQQYGPVPIVSDNAYAVSDDISNLSVERSTYDECIDYISNDMEKAYDYLLPNANSSAEFYQPTKGAALAVMSRVRLYAASPWYNGNSFYSNWKNSAGKNFINQAYDNSKWGKAAVAAKRVIDLKLYELHTIPRDAETPILPSTVSSLAYPDGAGNIDPYRSYSEMFNGETPALNNPEIIYSCNAIVSGDSPAWIAFPAQMGGGNGLGLTQGLVDAYKMRDGNDINSSSAAFPYPSSSEAYKPIGAGFSFSGFQLTANTAKMYYNREARFYATIAFCHSFWPGISYTGTEVGYKNVELTYYKDGNGAPNINFPNDYNLTGYTCKKYIHPEDNLRATMRAKAFPIFRYAEILLNYAEALNELDAPYTDAVTGITVSRDVNEIKSAFNRVRYRAGLPGLTDAEVADKATLRDIIKKERQVEFACEGKRYHDVRRWGDAMTVFNQPVVGMNVAAKTSQRELFYTRTTLTNDLALRAFSYKMYFYPVKRSILDRNAKLVQNPGW